MRQVMEFLGGKDVMPITGFFGPFPHAYGQCPHYFTDEIFQMIAETGINLIVYSATDYTTYPELVEKNLELGEKYGVGILVTDTSVLGKEKEEVKKRIEKYVDRKAFCGMYVVDEPGTADYLPGDGKRLVPMYKEITELLQKELGIFCYINMFPAADWVPDYQKKYGGYVKEFCDTLAPEVISWDHYPFDREGICHSENYFFNMDIIRTKAIEKNLPFWAFVQAGSQWNDSWDRFDSVTPYFPNKGQFEWNVNTSLAFGAKGIQYFPLIQPFQFALAKSTLLDCERNGIIGAVGNKTQWYYFAQEMNKHIAAIDDVLMNSVHKGIIVSGEQAKKDMSLITCEIKAGTFKQLKSVEGDVMVGCFDYQGKTAIYVVNYSFERAQTISLSFDGAQELSMIRNTIQSVVNGETLELEMAAGEGILIVIQ